MGCAGCFRDGKDQRKAKRDLFEKAKAFAESEGRDMVIYLTPDGQEYKFMYKDEAVANNQAFISVVYS